MLRIRPATFADAEAICQLQKRNSMGDLDIASWRNQWEAYPCETEFRDIPIGWVLETDDGSVVGSIDNIHTLYEIGGRGVKGVVAAGWAVDREYRSKSLQLMTTFLRQKGIDLALVVSASPTTAQVLTAMKVLRIPIPDYASPCFWAVRPRAFARAALVRRSVRAAELLAWPVGLGLLLNDVCRGSGRGQPSSSVSRLPQFDARFDEPLQSTSTVPTRLRAVRSKAVLEWRFRAELSAGRTALVVAQQGTKLLGYAILLRRSGSDLGMDLYDIADLQVAGDDPSILRDLLLGAIQIAREDGVDAVKFMSGTPAKRTSAVALRPYTYRLPFWQLYYKAATPNLASKLSAADNWDFSLFDTY